MGAAVPESQSLSYEIDSEGFKLVADRLVEEAGIRPMLHRLFVAPLLEGDRIVGVITESKAGREAILARLVVDATGDADVACRAGAPTFKTPPEQMQAASVMFHLAGVDKAAFLAAVRSDPPTYKDWSTGEWTVQTSGKEDDLFSPFLKKPFQRAIEAGIIPAHINTISGTWGAVRGEAEANLFCGPWAAINSSLATGLPCCTQANQVFCNSCMLRKPNSLSRAAGIW